MTLIFYSNLTTNYLQIEETDKARNLVRVAISEMTDFKDELLNCGHDSKGSLIMLQDYLCLIKEL